MENWKDVPGYEGVYQASNTGRIRSAPGKVSSNKRYSRRVWAARILKTKSPAKARRKDPRVTLWKAGESEDYLVSRLVAMTWIDGYSPELTVNHIDGNPYNNDSSNLEWITLSENIKKGFSSGLYANIQKPITLTRNNSEFEFASMSEASRFLGRNNGYIGNCMKCNRPVKDASGKQYGICFSKE